MRHQAVYGTVYFCFLLTIKALNKITANGIFLVGARL